MVGLEKLVLVIPEFHTDVFASEFASMNISLPKIHTLAVGPLCNFAVKVCPNVQTVAGNGYHWRRTRRADYWEREHTLALIRAAGAAGNVTTLEINDSWSVPLVEAILTALPDLPSLNLAGDNYIADLLPTLSRFDRLRRLALMDASGLGVGFDPPWCGNAYVDENGNEDTAFITQINAEQEEAENKVLKMVAPACSNLTELWIVDYSKAEILTDTKGKFVGCGMASARPNRQSCLLSPSIRTHFVKGQLFLLSLRGIFTSRTCGWK